MLLSLPQKDSKTICLRYKKRYISNANNITLSKNQYKHDHLNKASTSSNFGSVLILQFTFFLYVIIVNSTIYFRLAEKVFDLPLIEGYDVRNLKFKI